MFGANSFDDHGKFVYKNYIPDIPFIDNPDFIDRINLVIKQYDIHYIIPAHDSVLLKMAENQSIINATVITSCVETCKICRSKGKTYKVFENIIPTPKVYSITDAMIFPVFLKPDVGQGAKGTFKVNTKEEVKFYYKKDPTLLALEYLPGKEYTVDCFTDKNQKLIFVAGRERSRINGGISVNSKQVADSRFYEIADIINKTLSFQGVWFYQVKERSNGELVLMEIAPRVAGTMALFRADGVNFVQLSLFDRMGVDVSCMRNNLDIEIDRALFARFHVKHEYSYVYIDYDDTIIVNDMVNTNIMKFIYQSRNLNKKIILLSRHAQNIYNSLNKYSISKSLFDEIIIIGKDDNKSRYITNIDSVFIDDSFAERKEVFDTLHIPVFALDAVESLLLWKG